MSDDLKYSEPAIYELIKDVLPNRIFMGEAKMNQEDPFIIVQHTDSIEEFDSINDPANIVQDFIQVTSYDKSYYEAKKRGLKVKKILNKYRGTVEWGTNSPKDFLKIAGISFQNGLVLPEQMNDYPTLFAHTAFYLVTYHQQ